MHIIAFSGKMRSGKDSAADYLEMLLSQRGLRVKRVAFADTLKQIVSYAQQTAGVPIEKDRELLQYLGVHFRNINPLVWCNALRNRVQALEVEGETDVVLITDLRFRNELALLHQIGARVIRVCSPEALRIARGAEEGKLTHISETDLDIYDEANEWEHVIVNDRTLAEFYSEVQATVANAIPTLGIC